MPEHLLICLTLMLFCCFIVNEDNNIVVLWLLVPFSEHANVSKSALFPLRQFISQVACIPLNDCFLGVSCSAKSGSE